jgi:hypothetical protein
MNQVTNFVLHMVYLQPLHWELPQLYDMADCRYDSHTSTFAHTRVHTMLDLQHNRATHMFHDLQGRLLALVPSCKSLHGIRKLHLKMHSTSARASGS